MTRTRWVSLFVGLLFGVGLVISGMTRPDKVIGFLDVAGAWDPSLMFVMGGGVAVYAVAWHADLPVERVPGDPNLDRADQPVRGLAGAEHPRGPPRRRRAQCCDTVHAGGHNAQLRRECTRPGPEATSWVRSARGDFERGLAAPRTLTQPE